MRKKFTHDWVDCFFRDEDELSHVVRFCGMTRRSTGVEFYWPNHKQSPWHIQCVMRIDGQEKEVNFWPHKNKGQIIYEKAIEGMENLINEINRRAGEGDPDDDFDVIE